MKKRVLNYITLSIALLLIVVSFSSCFHKHEWVEASCFNPQTCVECGTTVGEPTPHDWVKATCTEASHCSICGRISGNTLPHKWVNATCSKAKYCATCGMSEGEPLPHDWMEATCTKSKVCKRCSMTQGEPLGHNWTEEAYDSPSMCLNCDEIKPLKLPKSGEVFIGKELYRGSQITITSTSSQSCYIKLKSTAGKDVFSFFVKADSTVTVPVPQGHFYVYFSYGNEWYGTEHLFGEQTTYAKDDEILDFNNYTWSYTLTPVYDGNFSETPINEEEFK